MRFEGVLDRSDRSEFSQAEAAELLGVSKRTFRRRRERYREEGVAGLNDRQLTPSPRGAPVMEIKRMSERDPARWRWPTASCRNVALPPTTRVAVAAEQTGSAFVRDATEARWETLCIQEDRASVSSSPPLERAWARGTCDAGALQRVRDAQRHILPPRRGNHLHTDR